MDGVWITRRRVRDALGLIDTGSPQVFTGAMADLAFVLLSIAVFALLALVVKGVERL
jgi:hypothetical protein